jgi:hypothetical protein
MEYSLMEQVVTFILQPSDLKDDSTGAHWTGVLDGPHKWSGRRESRNFFHSVINSIDTNM